MNGQGSLGQNLIFLVSQPRAGSTLLQKILANHPAILTISEPWLMLHPLYALKGGGYEAEYDARLASTSLRGFVEILPKGEEDYIEGIRRMYGYLYWRLLGDSGKVYFLDKTPRYYFILPELYRVFPGARFIVLIRNPLAVLASVITTWTSGDIYRLFDFRLDLMTAPQRLLEAMELLGPRAIRVQYEDVAMNPDASIQRICKGLGIDYVPEMIEYGTHEHRWPLGDQDEVYKRSRPAAGNAERWVQTLADPQVWRLARDYLEVLGKETVEKLGYQYEAMRQVLEASRPNRVRLWSTSGLREVLEKPTERNKAGRGPVRLVRSIRSAGLRGTASTLTRKFRSVVD